MGETAMGKMQRTWVVSAVILASLAAGRAGGEDLVYTPVNPSFGGNPFNSSHLLSIAQQQNQFDNRSFTPFTSQQQFVQSLERRILSRTSQEITDRIFGENQEESGEFTVGQQQIFFERRGADEVAITLTDLETGATTSLIVPAPAF